MMTAALSSKILDTIRQHRKDHPDDYVNPYFLQNVIEACRQYHNIGDDEIYEYIQEMFEM